MATNVLQNRARQGLRRHLERHRGKFICVSEHVPECGFLMTRDYLNKQRGSMRSHRRGPSAEDLCRALARSLGLPFSGNRNLGIEKGSKHHRSRNSNLRTALAKPFPGSSNLTLSSSAFSRFISSGNGIHFPFAN